MRTAWFQCASGASGDMLLAALVDAGAPLEGVAAAVDALGVPGIALSEQRVRRGGMTALKVHVRTDDAHHHRGWTVIRGLLRGAGPALTARARELAIEAFRRLADAESRVHGVPIDDVHFHEVGALDAIADIVGVCAAVDLLGIERAYAERVAVGGGTVRTAHGVLPVPAPAVVELLAEAGAPVHTGPAARELCTPTGAALLAVLVESWSAAPPVRMVGSGTGAGTAELSEAPNVLRVVLGETVPGDATADRSAATIVETNVDDLDPRLWPRVLDRLLSAGADDAWLTPILMKKGRPAHTVSVLTRGDAADAVRGVLFTETSAIGARTVPAEKLALPRTERTVRVGDDDVRVKIAWLGETPVNRQPEYDDLVAASERTGIPVKELLARAVAALDHPDRG